MLQHARSKRRPLRVSDLPVARNLMYAKHGTIVAEDVKVTRTGKQVSAARLCLLPPFVASFALQATSAGLGLRRLPQHWYSSALCLQAGHRKSGLKSAAARAVSGCDASHGWRDRF